MEALFGLFVILLMFLLQLRYHIDRLLLAIPLWSSALVLGVLAAILLLSRKHKSLRRAILTLGLILALPFALWWVLNRAAGNRAFRGQFDAPYPGAQTLKYLHKPGGFGDGTHYWKMKVSNANAYRYDSGRNTDALRRRLQDYRSLLSPPSWWPSSVDRYIIHETRTGQGVQEVWIPEKGTAFYFYEATY